MAITSSLGIRSIGESVNSLGVSISRAKRSTFTTSQILMNRTKVKRSSLFEDRRIFQQKREKIRIRDKESIIETSRLVNPIRKGVAAISRSAKGFLGRLMDFVGTLLTGWLLYNLPTIIAMAKELMARIGRMVELLKGFVGNLTSIMSGFGKVLGAVFQNVISFDFNDSSGRVKKEMDKLTGVFDDMKSQVQEGIDLITTSLGEGKVTGENAPPTGTKYPSQPEAGAPTPSGGRFSGSGVSKGTQIARRLQKDLGLKDYQAAAVVGNLLNESSQLNPAQIQNGGSGLLKVDGKTGYGWAQWTDLGRQRRLYQLAQSMGIDPSKQQLTDEVNYAMLVSELPEYDSGGRFRASKNINEASNWLLEQYFRPADRGPGEQRERIADSQKVLQGIKTTATATPSPVPAQVPPKPSGTSTSSTALAKTAERLKQQRLDTSRYGRDGCVYAVNEVYKAAGMTPPWGTSVYVPTARGILVKKGWKQVGVNGARPGDIVIMSDTHPTEPWIHIGIVSTKGTVIHNSSTNRALTNDEPFSSLVSRYVKIEVFRDPAAGAVVSAPPTTSNPSKALPTQALNQTQSFNFNQSTPTPAQIAALPQQRRQQLPSQLTPERKGSQILLIDDSQPQQPPTPAAGGGGGGIIPIVINPLNSYITKKLMFDLAYT